MAVKAAVEAAADLIDPIEVPEQIVACFRRAVAETGGAVRGVETNFLFLTGGGDHIRQFSRAGRRGEQSGQHEYERKSDGGPDQRGLLIVDVWTTRLE